MPYIIYNIGGTRVFYISMSKKKIPPYNHIYIYNNIYIR